MRILLCSAAVLFATATARADEPLSIATTPAATASTAADPNIDRGFVLPTAMTQPAGSLTYNNYELLLHGVTYGLTDNVQVSATVVAPIIKDMPFLGLASMKGRLYRGERLHLALQGTMGGGSISQAGIFMVGAGGLASICLRQDCSSLLSASANLQFLTGSRTRDGGGNSGTALVYGVSAVHRVGPHVKLLAEVASAGDVRSGSFGGGALLSYGVRFYSNNIASDIGFIKPIGGDTAGPFLLGLPFASVSYRWQ
jgi:hypothetical protein